MRIRKDLAVLSVIIGAGLVLGAKTAIELRQEKAAKAQAVADQAWEKLFDSTRVVTGIKAQTDFGPRIPGSKAQKDTRDYLKKEIENLGGEFKEQFFEATYPEFLKREAESAINLMGSFWPDQKRRVILASHWDTRKFSDKDPANPQGKLDGAIDGASGVAMALEIVRVLREATGNNPPFGVDVLFFDAEDQGLMGSEPGIPYGVDLSQTWCMGSQFWLTSDWGRKTKAEFGILFDMVAGRGAVFPKEGNSMLYAEARLEHFWGAAAELGHGEIFSHQEGPPITDDHIYMNRAGIPTIDIIDLRVGSRGDIFAPFHHRQSDSLTSVDPEVIRAVGETVLKGLRSSF